MRYLPVLPLLALIGAIPGCPICPDGELRAVGDLESVPPGGSLDLEFHWNGALLFGAGACGGFWYVDEILWGDDTVGTITDCGSYTAPVLEPPAGEVTIWAMEYESGTCADCCPFASRVVDIES